MGGTVLTRSAAVGTTLSVAIANGRDGIGIELNAEYIALAEAHHGDASLRCLGCDDVARPATDSTKLPDRIPDIAIRGEMPIGGRSGRLETTEGSDLVSRSTNAAESPLEAQFYQLWVVLGGWELRHNTSLSRHVDDSRLRSYRQQTIIEIDWRNVHRRYRWQGTTGRTDTSGIGSRITGQL